MIRHWQISTQSKETLLYRHQQVGDGKPEIGTYGVTKEPYGDAWTYHCLVLQYTTHDGSERWRTDEGDARDECGVGVYTKEGTQQHVEEQGADGGDGDKEEEVGTDLGEGAQADLRGYGDAEDEDKESACLEGALQSSDSAHE